MSWESVAYYVGYVAAIFLCRGLGNLFFVPMLLNMGFNIALQTGLLSGWDIRWVIAGHGFLFFLWTATLAGIFDRTTVVILLVMDFFAAYKGLVSQLQMAGSGGHFWDVTSTTIIQVWLMSILIVSLSAIVKSSIVSKVERGYSELLVIPKKRFLIPIAVWAAIIVLPEYLGSAIPEVVKQNRFTIAGLLLVWGWVAIELPFFIMYKRLRSNAD